MSPITPASYQNSNYIFTISDHFSKFVQAIAMESKHASNVAAALFFGEIKYSYFIYVPNLSSIVLCFIRHRCLMIIDYRDFLQCSS